MIESGIIAAGQGVEQERKMPFSVIQSIQNTSIQNTSIQDTSLRPEVRYDSFD